MLAAKLLDIWEKLPIESSNPSIEEFSFKFPKDKVFIKGMFPSRFRPNTMLPLMSFAVTITETFNDEKPSEPKGAVLTFLKTLDDVWLFTLSEDVSKGILHSEMVVAEGMLPVLEKLSNKEPAEMVVRNGDDKKVVVHFKPVEVTVN
jgi:hypothetical protein